MFSTTTSLLYKIQSLRKMSAFIQKMNPITGQNDWVVQNEDYDYHQEVARAAFADMLHDTERNQLYEKALKSAINLMHSRGQRANILDIGTGTGLLSMMAVRNGADTVTACEAFKPMSDCAMKVIARNNFRGKITIIPKRSTDLTVGEKGDLKSKCNILVTEVFDTELIGEGALSTFNHAHKHLLETDCIVIPESATIYAQVVECHLAQNWNRLKDIFDDDGKVLIRVPDSIKRCAGSAAVHDIQLNQLPFSSVNAIAPAIPVLHFDWSGRTPLSYERTSINEFTVEQNGTVQAVFMWWQLQMDTEAKIMLSCAPWWETGDKVPWRDHWMQAIYYLPKEVPVKKGAPMFLISCHDEYSLWFNVSPTSQIEEAHCLNPICECGLHVTFSRTRIGQMNDARKYKKFLALLEKNLNSDSEILLLGDGFYLGLVAAKLGAKRIFQIDTNSLSRRILHNFIETNKLTNVEVISSSDELQKVDLTSVTMVLGEPYFSTSILPWDNLQFYYLVNKIRKCLSEDVQIFPKKAVIKAAVVQFKDLHKIRSPLSTCEGFVMDDFDKLIEDSSQISDDNVEAQPLWEYPCIALTEETEMIRIDMTKTTEETIETRGSFLLKGDEHCNGIAFWVEWNLDDTPKSTINTGPLYPIKVGKKISWDMYTRQGVHLFPNKKANIIGFSFKFDCKEGNITFKCT